MKEYLLLLSGGKPMAEKSETEMQVEMQAWGIYMASLENGEHLAGGAPLVPGRIIVSATGVTAAPGVSHVKSIVDGYLIIKAQSIVEAAELAKKCPHVDNGGDIEVREIAPTPRM